MCILKLPMSQVMSNTSVKAFLAPKSGGPPNVCLLYPAPLTPCSAAYVKRDNKLLFFFCYVHVIL